MAETSDMAGFEDVALELLRSGMGDVRERLRPVFSNVRSSRVRLLFGDISQRLFL